MHWSIHRLKQNKKPCTAAPHWLQLVESKDEELQLQRASCKVKTRLGTLRPVLFKGQLYFLCWERRPSNQSSSLPSERPYPGDFAGGSPLPVQETWVWSPAWEGSARLGAADSHTAAEPELCTPCSTIEGLQDAPRGVASAGCDSRKSACSGEDQEPPENK